MMNMKKVHVPHIETSIPGPRSQDALNEQGKYETSSISYPRSFPFAIKSIRDSVIEDLDGNLFIDWMTGISVLNLGYANFIRDAVKLELDSTWHALEIPTEARINFLKALRSSFPQNMQQYKTIFWNKWSRCMRNGGKYCTHRFRKRCLNYRI